MLYVHRSERADHLAEILASVVCDPLTDPMTAEVVAVPTRGVERWLSQRLSHRLGCSSGREDGVAANIEFPFPGTLVGSAVTTATGADPDLDPWVPERAVWPLLEVIDAHRGDEDLSPLQEHLSSASPFREDGALARFATARHLADLFDQYGVHRPAMVRQWAGGGDDAIEDLGRHRWQGHLWQLLRERIASPSPAERLDDAVNALAADPELLELPRRVSLFGLTRLPPSYLAVLQAIARARDVHLFLLHPSGALWDAVAGTGDRGNPAELSRAADTTPALVDNSLLRSWGRDGREMQLVLASHGAATGEYRGAEVEGSEPATLLQWVQHDIRHNLAVPPLGQTEGSDPRRVLECGDTSLRFHSCHGRFRQVEVLHEALLHLLAEDPTLEARDVIVMCPDVEAFAPLIEAIFGRSDAQATEDDAGRQLRVKLADRSLRQTNPLLGVTARLLELAGSRLTASEVIDLAGREPVRRRFGFDDDDLAQIERWVADMGARWGLDSEHRGNWKLARIHQNTWEFGADRLLLGVAMSEEGSPLFGGTLPLDDVPGGSVDLAGRFAEFLSRLRICMRQLSGRGRMADWCSHLADATESLACAEPGEGWQLAQMRRLLDDTASEAGERDVPLTLPEVRALLANRLRGRPTRANFRTGDLTVCTLVPMRSVPHRVVCLLGLDDGVFPRHPEPDGDDLIAADPRVGDRDARSEDRQLLLDALLAATDHVVVTYGGRDERTNRPRLPAVPIAELLDAVDRTVRPPEGFTRVRDAVVIEHPLQAFDPRNFLRGELVAGRAWGFGDLELSGARSWLHHGGERPPFLDGPLPPRESDVISLDALVRFLKHPVQSFLRERLGVFVSGDFSGPDEPCDALPIELDGLEKWAVGDRILRARLRGAPLEDAVAAESARGTLPPAHLADAVLGDITVTAEQLVDALEKLVPDIADGGIGSFGSAEINLTLPGGGLLLGTIPGVRGATLVNAVYSRLAPKHRLEAWVKLLALSASRPELTPLAVTVARSPARNHPVTASVIGGLPAGEEELSTWALDQLCRLIDLYHRGMSEPLPLYGATSHAWAQEARSGGDALQAAAKEWEADFYGGESTEECHLLVLGGNRSFDWVLGEPPAAGESGTGWDDRETSRFGRIARRLWDPLLEHEKVVFP